MASSGVMARAVSARNGCFRFLMRTSKKECSELLDGATMIAEQPAMYRLNRRRQEILLSRCSLALRAD
jgi:hypothetical protein